MNGERVRGFPVPPAVAAEIVRQASDPNTQIGELARLVEKDAALTAQLLRTINSASYGLRNKVASVDRAVSYLGIRGLRNLALVFSVRNISAANVGEFPIDSFWESSLRRGAAVQHLAEMLKLPNADEYFTLGLCQDIGLLVQIAEDESTGSKMADVLYEPSDRRRAVEQEFGPGHDELGFAMFSEWKLPDSLAVPIRFHHRPNEAPEPYRQAARVAWAGEAIADLANPKERTAALALSIARVESLGLEADGLRPMLEHINGLVADFSDVFGIKVGDLPDPERILSAATEGLAEISTSYLQLTRGLEDALRSQEEIADELRDRNQVLSREAHTDTLTGLGNRRAFKTFLHRSLSTTSRQDGPLSILMLDLDHFKRVNDQYGHATGDRVLQHVAALLRSLLRSSDMATRYGGEEFAVILPFAGQGGASVVAERIRAIIEHSPLDPEGEAIPITVSVGGASLDVVRRSNDDTGVRLVELADLALYEAKKGGRNQVRWH